MPTAMPCLSADRSYQLEPVERCPGASSRSSGAGKYEYLEPSISPSGEKPQDGLKRDEDVESSCLVMYRDAP